MRSALYQYVRSVKMPRHEVFLAPTWGHWKDLRYLDQAVDDFRRTGVLPDNANIFVLSNAPLTAQEIQDYENRLLRVGPAMLPQIQDAVAELQPTQHRMASRSQRGQSNAKLQAVWRFACLRHWMTADVQCNQFEYRLLQRLAS